MLTNDEIDLDWLSIRNSSSRTVLLLTHQVKEAANTAWPSPAQRKPVDGIGQIVISLP